MVKVQPFEVEQWMDRFENTPGVLNLAETCADSISVDDLVRLDRRGSAAPAPVDYSRRMTYGAIRGSHTLRAAIADTYNSSSSNSTEGEAIGESSPSSSSPPISAEHVVVTPGAINANFLLFYTLVGPGDHVVCVYPAYQQLYSVPESLGADVSLWRLRPEDGHVPDVAALEALMRSNTKMIVINNPNNPTGAITPAPVLRRIADVARRHGAILLCDEVYSPLYHSLDDDAGEGEGGGDSNGRSGSSKFEAAAAPPTALALGYERVVVTGSISKAWALAGIRVGWLATRDRAVLDAAAAARDYTTISVSQVDDQLAAYALGPDVRPRLLERNLALARRNRDLLAAFVDAHPAYCRWPSSGASGTGTGTGTGTVSGASAPRAGTTGFLQFTRGDGSGEPVDDDAFCRDLLAKTRVFLVPGSLCFGRGVDFRGCVRLGYVCDTEVLKQGLAALSVYVKENL